MEQSTPKSEPNADAWAAMLTCYKAAFIAESDAEYACNNAPADDLYPTGKVLKWATNTRAAAFAALMATPAPNAIAVLEKLRLISSGPDTLSLGHLAAVTRDMARLGWNYDSDDLSDVIESDNIPIAWAKELADSWVASLPSATGAAAA